MCATFKVMSDAPDELLTAREVAKTFRIHHSTVLRWARDGTLDAITIGKVVRFRRSDIEVLISGAA